MFWNKNAKEEEAIKRKEWLDKHTFSYNDKVRIVLDGKEFGTGRVLLPQTQHDDYSVGHYYEVELEPGVKKLFGNWELEKA